MAIGSETVGLTTKVLALLSSPIRNAAMSNAREPKKQTSFQ